MRLKELSRGGLACALLALSTAVPAVAQPVDAGGQSREGAGSEADDGEPDGGTIVVTGRRQPGAVIGDIAPEQQLNVGDIRALGVSSVAELLTELAPETRSDRGRGGEQPVTLLNGRRISSFSEIRDIPAEAIERVDILPEEVALKYGYSADQRVVNIVLRRRFRAVTGELEGGTTTQGGGDSGQAELNLLHIRRDQRLNLHAEYQRSAAITEDQRGLVSRSGGEASDPNIADMGRFRTIRPETHMLDLNGVYARTVFTDIAATINATLDVNDSEALRGLPRLGLASPVGDPDRPLTQRTASTTGHLGFTLDKDLAKWRLSLTGNYDRAATSTRTMRAIDPDVGDPVFTDRRTDRARARSDSGNVQFVATGPVAALPAGPLTMSFKAGAAALALDATSIRSTVATSSDLSRTDLNGRLNVDLPLASRRNGVLAAIGDLSLNANAAFDRYSDFGALGSWGYGASWTPLGGVGLIFSATEDRNPPSVQQLGNPLVSTPDVRTFDYSRGATVDITQLSGGNPALSADRRRITKLGLTLKPFKADVTLTANYVNSHIRNAIASFPEPTAPIEAAFPDRFIRGVDGDLLSIDTRPINFARQDRSELRWGVTFSQRLKTSERLLEAMRSSPRLKRQREQRAAAAAARGEAGQAGPAGQGGQAAPEQIRGSLGGMRGFGGAGGRGGGQGGRLQFSVYHTWHFKDEVLIRRGLPALDLLNGDTIGADGGTARHELEAQFTYSNNGIGLRLTGNWQGGTTVDGAPGSPTGDLRFSPQTTVNARLFVNLGQIPALIEQGWAQGARLSLRIDNLFDSHPRVRDATGATPLRYQPGYLDPAGRTVRLQLRKLLF